MEKVLIAACAVVVALIGVATHPRASRKGGDEGSDLRGGRSARPGRKAASAGYCDGQAAIAGAGSAGNLRDGAWFRAISNWDGIFVPAKTPARIADRLFDEITKALKHPELVKRQNAFGLVPVASASRADFARFIKDDTARWGKIIKEANIRVD
jgi:hypothetical protein